jgi:hypothetical protein
MGRMLLAMVAASALVTALAVPVRRAPHTLLIDGR